MEDLKLPSILKLLWDVKRAIEKNQSFLLGIKKFVENEPSDVFAKNFIIWWKAIGDKNEADAEKTRLQFNSIQKPVVDLLALGLKGFPIYEQIKLIESDLLELCESDIQEHIALAPLKMQFPLIFFIFPSISILMLVPALSLMNF